MRADKELVSSSQNLSKLKLADQIEIMSTKVVRLPKSATLSFESRKDEHTKRKKLVNQHTK